MNPSTTLNAIEEHRETMSEPSDVRQVGFYWVLSNTEWRIAWWGWNPLAFGYVNAVDEDAPFGWWGIADELNGNDDSYDKIGARVERHD